MSSAFAEECVHLNVKEKKRGRERARVNKEQMMRGLLHFHSPLVAVLPTNALAKHCTVCHANIKATEIRENVKTKMNKNMVKVKKGIKTPLH